MVDKLAPKRPGFIAREISFLKTITSRQIKATLPAPALLGERMWHPEKSAKAYPKREDFVRDCVPILKRELELIQKAGADIIQIDDPHLCLFVDPNTRRQFSDPDAAADFAVDMVNAIVDGSRNVKLAVHLCRRAGARVRGEAQFQGGYEPIINQLNRLRVHHLTMEFTAPGSGDLTVLQEAARGFRDRPGLRQRHARRDRFTGDDRGPGAAGGQGPCPGADRAQPRLRICAGLRRGGQHRRGVPQALQ